MVKNYLARRVGEPFVWGVCDCCTFALDWVVEQRGVDPMAAFRGRYDSRHSAAQVLQASGGFIPTVIATLQAAGLLETMDPSVGDIGLIQTKSGPLLAIRGSAGWVAKSPGAGLCRAEFPVIRAWAV